MTPHKNLSIWFVLLAICFGIAPRLCMAQQKSEIEFRVSLEKSIFIEGEPIIVTSALTNKSDKVQIVKEPTALGFVSAFNLEMGEGDKKQKFGHIVGGGVPGWQSAPVRVLPQQTINNTCELSWQISANLMREKYLLLASYHLSDYGQADYETNIIKAEPVPFRIIEASGKEKLAQGALATAVNNTELSKKKEALKKFLADYPDSVYRVPALEELDSAEYYDKNSLGTIDVYLQILKENISTSKRELITTMTADELAKRGDIVAALDILKDSNQPQILLMKKNLERKLKRTTPAQNQ